MSLPVGLRFCPTDEQIFDGYLIPKNLGDTLSSSDELINTIDMYSFDPWHLPFESKIKSEDQEWFFFNLMKNKYKKGERKSSTTKSGFWKKTGKTKDIMRKSFPHEKIGEKRVLVFYLNKKHGGSKSNWVMHEYQSVSSSPTQNMAYTFCRVLCKGENGLHNQELQNSIHNAFNNLSSHDWKSLLDICDNNNP